MAEKKKLPISNVKHLFTSSFFIEIFFHIKILFQIKWKLTLHIVCDTFRIFLQKRMPETKNNTQHWFSGNYVLMYPFQTIFSMCMFKIGEIFFSCMAKNGKKFYTECKKLCVCFLFTYVSTIKQKRTLYLIWASLLLSWWWWSYYIIYILTCVFILMESSF